MRIIVLSAVALLLSACASTVNLDYDKQADFAAIKTFSIVAEPVRVAEDTRINSPFVKQRVVNNIRQVLQQKGLRYQAQQADMTVRYYLDLRQEIESNDSYMSLGLSSSGHYSGIGFGMVIPVGEVSSNDKLFLTIDMVSGNKEKLLWRASQGSYLYQGSDVEDNDKLIHSLVMELLQHYPPKRQ